MDFSAEWLEADGAGGFASGTVGGERTRRYHAVLLTAVTPPTGRLVLVNGLEAWVETAAGHTALSTQRYTPDVVHPDGWSRIAAFSRSPWPCWRFTLPGGADISFELTAAQGGGTALRWRFEGQGRCRLSVRLLLSGRDYHALHHENPAFDFAATEGQRSVVWRPYAGLPGVLAQGGFAYQHQPEWYRRFLYTAEQQRGLDAVEDLASPGVLHWDLDAAGTATLLLQALPVDAEPGPATDPAAVFEAERRRRAGVLPLRRAADQYVAARGAGRTLIAGYPWFTDWGRDTFIAMRGLVLATGRVEMAGDILRAWAGLVSEGMVPNRFSDEGDAAEYNAVDASLWFVVAASEYMAVAPGPHPGLVAAVEQILACYAAGTRFGIGMDQDGLVHAGQAGYALTWMDARLHDWVVTPRIGKPVEVQALWINALHMGAGWSQRWAALERQARASFLRRFPNPCNGGLFDVVDVDGVPGTADASVRPNQVFAVGGLPVPLLEGAPACRVLDLIENRLLTPLGLRTLAPGEPGYCGHYRGGPAERDGSYHQGTAWPWLLGPFVEGWLRVRGATADAKAEARVRFLAPLHAHLDVAGLGHVSEVADGDPPHQPGGCPFQAWSMSELIRIEGMLGG